MKIISFLFVSTILFPVFETRAQPRFSDGGIVYSLEELAAVVIGSKDPKEALAALDVLEANLGKTSHPYRAFLFLISRPSIPIEAIVFGKNGDLDFYQILCERFLETGEYPNFPYEEPKTLFDLALVVMEKSDFKSLELRNRAMNELLSKASRKTEADEKPDLRKFGPFFMALTLFYEFNGREIGIEGLRFIKEKTKEDTFLFGKLLLKIRGKI